MKRGIWDARWPVLVALLAVLAIGCVSLPNLPPGPLPTTKPGEPPMDPSPICSAPTLVRNCYVRPPGEPWSYLCADGLTKVTGPAECSGAPKPPTGCPVITDDDAAKVDQTQDYAPDYGSAILALQAHHPDWFTFDEYGHWQAKRAGDEGSYPTPPAVDAFRAQFFAELGAQFVGLCSQVIGDELHVFDSKAQPIVSERYKPFEYGGGRQMQKPYMGRTLAVVIGGPVVTPTPGPRPTPTPAAPSDACDPTTPDASTFKLDVRWNSAHTVAWIDATPKVNDRDWCGAHYCADCEWPDNRMLVVCPLAREGAPTRVDCDKKHGTPAWFMGTPNGSFAPVASDENDAFHLHAPLGATVKACLADGVACSPELELK